MDKVIDLSAERAKRWEEQQRIKKENDEIQRLVGFFHKYFGDEPSSVQDAVKQAIIDKDYIRYREITDPIIIRKSIKEVNAND